MPFGTDLMSMYNLFCELSIFFFHLFYTVSSRDVLCIDTFLLSHVDQLLIVYDIECYVEECK